MSASPPPTDLALTPSPFTPAPKFKPSPKLHPQTPTQASASSCSRSRRPPPRPSARSTAASSTAMPYAPPSDPYRRNELLPPPRRPPPAPRTSSGVPVREVPHTIGDRRIGDSERACTQVATEGTGRLCTSWGAPRACFGVRLASCVRTSLPVRVSEGGVVAGSLQSRQCHTTSPGILAQDAQDQRPRLPAHRQPPRGGVCVATVSHIASHDSPIT